MLRKRFWLVLAIMLAAWGSFSSAQQQNADPDIGIRGAETPDRDDAPADGLPTPFPIQVIENDEAAKARERREEVSRQYERDLLRSQQGVEIATREMNDASQRMASYSLISTFAVIVGTGLLLWTLVLTRQANKAAQLAVAVTREIGQAQARAYVSAEGLNIRDIDVDYQARLYVKNAGQTPARNLAVRAGIKVATVGDLAPPDFQVANDPTPWGTLSAGREIGLDLAVEGLEECYQKVIDGAGRRAILIYGTISYETIFDGERFETDFCFYSNRGKTMFRHENGETVPDPLDLSRPPFSLRSYDPQGTGT